MKNEKLYSRDCINAIKELSDIKLEFIKSSDNMIGFEKNEEYCDMALERINEFIDKE